MHGHVKIGALLAIVGLAVCAARADEGFSFVQLTDLHLGGGTDHLHRATAAIEAVNALPMPLACVLVTGDLGRDDLDDSNAVVRIRRVLGRIHAPVHVIPGNHDVLAKRWTATTNAFASGIGPLQTNVTYHGVTFLLLTDETLHDESLAAAHPDCDPLGWLDRELQRVEGQPVILVHHRPEVEDFHDNAFHPGWPEAIRARWTEIVNRHHVSAEIVGHFHRDELHWLGHVPVYVAPPLAGYYGRQASFRIYTWKDGHLSYRTVYLE